MSETFPWVCPRCGPAFSDPELLGTPWVCPHCGTTLVREADSMAGEFILCWRIERSGFCGRSILSARAEIIDQVLRGLRENNPETTYWREPAPVEEAA
jgi:DNA-directed RNA polymerase subunit RPC12/RpoP